MLSVKPPIGNRKKLTINSYYLSPIPYHQKGFIDPLSIAAIGFLVVSLFVGTIEVTKTGSFDPRNWAMQNIDDYVANRQYVKQQTAARQANQSASQPSSSSDKNESNNVKNDTKTSTQKTQGTSKKDTFGYVYTADDLKSAPSYAKDSPKDTNGVGFVSGTYVKDGKRYPVNTPATMKAYQNSVNNTIKSLQNASLDDLKAKVPNGDKLDLSKPEDKQKLYTSLLILDSNSQKKAESVVNNIITADEQTKTEEANKATNSTKTEDNSNAQPNSANTDTELATLQDEHYNFYTDTSIPTPNLAALFCAGNKDASCINNFKREDLLSILPDNRRFDAIETLQTKTSKIETDNKTEIAAYLSTNITDDQLSTAYCTGKSDVKACKNSFQRPYIISKLPYDLQVQLVKQYLTNANSKGSSSKTASSNPAPSAQTTQIAPTDNTQPETGQNANSENGATISIPNQKLSIEPEQNNSSWIQSTLKTLQNKLPILFRNLPLSPQNTGQTPSTSSQSQTVPTNEQNPTGDIRDMVVPVNPPTTSNEQTGTVQQTAPAELVYYNQWDPKWTNTPMPAKDEKGNTTYFGPNGCGETATAMLLATYTDPGITPDQVLKKYYPSTLSGGTGASLNFDVLQERGFEVQRTHASNDSIKKSIENGWYAWIDLSYVNRKGETVTHHSLAVNVDKSGKLVFDDPAFGQGTTLDNINWKQLGVVLIKPPKK